MREYARTFGDFIINDGRHNVDKYGLIAMTNTLVESLGKSVMSCYSQVRSEHFKHLLRACKFLDLNQIGATLMTDDGPAYHILAQQFQ